MEPFVLEHICSFISSPSDLINFLKTCKRFSSLLKKESVWKQNYETNYKTDIIQIDASQSPETIEEKQWGAALFLKDFTKCVDWLANYKNRFFYQKFLGKLPENSVSVEPDEYPRERYHRELPEEIKREGFVLSAPPQFSGVSDDESEVEGDTEDEEEDLNLFSLFSWDDKSAASMIEGLSSPTVPPPPPPLPPPSPPKELIVEQIAQQKRRKDRQKRREEKQAKSLAKQREALKPRQEHRAKLCQKMKELSAVVFYAVLKLTYEEMLAELEETHSQEKVMEKLDKVWSIDPYHFVLLVHPHTFLSKQLKERGEQNAWPSKSSNSLFHLQGTSPGMPPVMLLQMDNVEWSPEHHNWGFYSNFCGEIFIWGKLLDLVTPTCKVLEKEMFICPAIHIKNFKNLNQ